MKIYEYIVYYIKTLWQCKWITGGIYINSLLYSLFYIHNFTVWRIYKIIEWHRAIFWHKQNDVGKIHTFYDGEWEHKYTFVIVYDTKIKGWKDLFWHIIYSNLKLCLGVWVCISVIWIIWVYISRYIQHQKHIRNIRLNTENKENTMTNNNHENDVQNDIENEAPKMTINDLYENHKNNPRHHAQQSKDQKRIARILSRRM